MNRRLHFLFLLFQSVHWKIRRHIINKYGLLSEHAIRLAIEPQDLNCCIYSVVSEFTNSKPDSARTAP